MSMIFNWTCPYCGHAQTITGSTYENRNVIIGNKQSRYGKLAVQIQTIVCSNQDCQEITFKLKLYPVQMTSDGRSILTDKPLHSWQLLPESEARPQPECIPEPIRRDYREACLIRNLSPNASAAMSRRCLQGMVRGFWSIKGKNNLWQEIEAIKDKVEPKVWEAIHAVRDLGNIGAHMRKETDRLLDVEPEEAQSLIGLIEMLFKEWYVAKYERDRSVDELIALSQSKKNQENAPAKPTGTLE